ncbi:MAG TPA: Gfo/Idh/MocA family oxidoreductase [Chloroflexota bacterium]|nr:Gfo/Idh/MocA family oxidoreductase [Chloroflexota bacterium]
MLDVAVVGAGNRGAVHLDTISRLTDLYRLVGVCDAREERRTWAATTFGAPVFDHPVTLLEEARPQLVVVVVPPDAHHLITAAAAARGCHVLSETPIATTLAMADHMIESCRRAGVVLEVAEQVWRWPQERLKRLAVDAGLIGQVTQVHLWYRSGSYHGMNALRRFITSTPRRVLGLSRDFPVAPFLDLDGHERRHQTWELGAIDFEGGQLALYQWPVGSDRGNLWEVIGTEGAIMGADLLRFDGPRRAGRRVPIEPLYEPAPDGKRALVAVRLSLEPGAGNAESASPGRTLEWENPYRRYQLPGPDDVARADIYAGMHEAITGSAGPHPPTAGAGAARAEAPEWPTSPPPTSRHYGGPNARADQALLVAMRESARRGSSWLDLPLPAAETTAFERQLHAEFEQTYGAGPFDDPERLLGRLFPRRGLTQTVH